MTFHIENSICWNLNDIFQISVPNILKNNNNDFLNRNCDKPRLIEALKTKRIRDIACGSSHSAAITSSGELYSWGLGEYGRLGHGDNTTQLRPKLVRLYL